MLIRSRQPLTYIYIKNILSKGEHLHFPTNQLNSAAYGASWSLYTKKVASAEFSRCKEPAFMRPVRPVMEPNLYLNATGGGSESAI